jgi:probable phosphoglycerate mutase
MKQIYIIRHGETELNRKGVVQGSGVDTQLNELGWQQAQAFYQRYGQLPFEVVLTSSLQRTHQTVRGFIERGVAWEQWPEINEISWGIHEGQTNTPEREAEYAALVTQWNTGNYAAKITGGESAEELATRMQHFVEALKKRPERHILICSHGRSMRCLLCLLKEIPLHRMNHFNHANTALYKVQFDGQKFHFQVENDLSHLEIMPIL